MPKQITNYLKFSDKGTREKNQDCLACYKIEEDIAVRSKEIGELFILSDGMGGHKAGKEAAEEVCHFIYDEYFCKETKLDFNTPDHVLKHLKTIAEKINDHLLEKAMLDESLSNWGCTASALIIKPPYYYILHTGDTRIYLLRNKKSALLTEDHNIAFQMYKLKKLSYEKYLKSKGHNKLLSHFGMKQGISIQTDFGELQNNDNFLICSDGLNQFMQFQDVDNVLKEQNDSFRSLYDTLKTDIIQTHKAKDNVSFLIVNFI